MLYTPIAVPLAASGAVTLISEGSLASSTLNAVKNASSAAVTPHKLCCANISRTCAPIAKAITSMNTCFILSFFSAMMMNGNISTKATSITGK